MSVTRDALKNKIKSNPKLYNTLYDIQIGRRTYKSEIYDHEMVGQKQMDYWDGIFLMDWL